MKMLMITDGHTCKTTHLASQKVNLLYMRDGIYPLELAERWITHGCSRKACLNPAFIETAKWWLASCLTPTWKKPLLPERPASR